MDDFYRVTVDLIDAMIIKVPPFCLTRNYLYRDNKASMIIVIEPACGTLCRLPGNFMHNVCDIPRAYIYCFLLLPAYLPFHLSLSLSP